MPFIEIAVYGRSVTAQEKERLFAGCVDVMVHALKSRPGQVRVAVHPWPEGSFYAGAAEGEGGGGARQERVGV